MPFRRWRATAPGTAQPAGAGSPAGAARSIDAFERGGFALFGRAGGVAGAEQLAGQALLADLLAGIGLRAAGGSGAGQFQAGRRLLARFARPGGVDDLARAVGSGDVLRARRPGLWR